MTKPALSAIEAAIAALTVESIEQIDSDGEQLQGEQVALFHRSIGRDLERIEKALSASGETLLSATAASIDEALLALAEARGVLRTEAF